MARKNLKYSDATQRVLNNCVVLRMPGAKAKLEEIIAQPATAGLSVMEVLGRVLDYEIECRTRKRVERLLKESGLRRLPTFATAVPENLRVGPERGLSPEIIKRLLSLDWLRSPTPPSVVISGPSGTGKTWLCSLIGRRACEESMTVLYIRFPELLERLQDAHDHHESSNYRHSLVLKRLLIIDDFGIGAVNDETRSDFLSLIEARIHVAATIVSGQLAPADWYDYLGRGHATDAIIDRLINSYNIELSGHSLRELERPSLE